MPWKEFGDFRIIAYNGRCLCSLSERQQFYRILHEARINLSEVCGFVPVTGALKLRSCGTEGMQALEIESETDQVPLSTALANDDLETAAPLAVDAHDLGHDLSHAAEHWLGTLSGGHGDHAPDGDDCSGGVRCGAIDAWPILRWRRWARSVSSPG
jgi:hypothetical protein